MLTAIEKTKNLKRIEVPIGDLVPSQVNPNEMTDAQFNMLCSNFEETGFTDPVLVRELPDGKYRIVGGHHRWEVAKLYDFETVPCTVITDPDFDEDREKFQVVRMNMIRGQLSPKKFFDLYNSLSNKYDAEIAAEAFGFVQQEEFEKLIGQMSKSLPAEMQGEFKKAAAEIKTIDGLSKLLNSMFSKYGDTLPYGYMVLDFGGKESVWLRMSTKEKASLLELGKKCMLEGVTLDSVVAALVTEVQKPTQTTLMNKLLQAGVKADVAGMEMPTEENLAIQ